MNSVTLIGRLTSEPELKRTQSGKTMLSFTLAVSRQKDNTDFIRCTAWGKSAEFIQKYFNKGSMIAVQGNIRAGNYTDRDGNTRYIMNVSVEKAFFTGAKSSRQQTNGYNSNYRNNSSQKGYSQKTYQNRNSGYNGYGNY